MIDSSSILFRVSSPARRDDTQPADKIYRTDDVLDPSDQADDAPPVELVPARSGPAIAQQRSLLRSVEAINSNLTADSRLVVHSAPYGIGAYRYRMLRVYLQALWRAGKVKSLLVTSALPGEGKTTAALNLAVGLAEHGGGTVVVVEADFRRPSVHRQLGLTPWPGFVHCLQNNIDPLTAVRRVDPLHIYLLPAGEVAAQPIELLNSEEFATTMARLKASADWVIIDSPPACPVPDVLSIRKNADGCLWVLRAGYTQREVVDEALDQVGREFVLGMMLNQADGLNNPRTQHYGYGSPTSLSLWE